MGGAAMLLGLNRARVSQPKAKGHALILPHNAGPVLDDKTKIYLPDLRIISAVGPMGSSSWGHSAKCLHLAANSASDWQWRCSCAGKRRRSSAVTSATNSLRRRRPLARAAAALNEPWPTKCHSLLAATFLIQLIVFGAAS